jgi:hypothetical protein
VEIGGKRFVGTVVVKRTEKQRFHLEDVFLLENLQKEAASKTGDVAASGTVALPGAAPSGDILNVLLSVFSVNPDNVSRVVDPDTGEPIESAIGNTGAFNRKHNDIMGHGGANDAKKAVFAVAKDVTEKGVLIRIGQ